MYATVCVLAGEGANGSMTILTSFMCLRVNKKVEIKANLALRK